MNRLPRLIINADDFGLHSAINRAIAAAHFGGIVTSCSLIPPASDRNSKTAGSFADAVAIARETPTLDVGLHFTLVGLPGQPRGYRDFLAAYAAGRYPPSRIEQVLNRQIDQLERSGIHPSHIDSHQHLHVLPGIMRIVCRVANQRGVRGIRLPLERGRSDAPFGRRLAARALGVFASLSERFIDRAALWHPDCFLGMAASGHLTESRLLALIDRMPKSGVTEIIRHPGADKAALAQEFDWGYDWEAELGAVTNASARTRTAERGIELTSFAREAR